MAKKAAKKTADTFEKKSLGLFTELSRLSADKAASDSAGTLASQLYSQFAKTAQALATAAERESQTTFNRGVQAIVSTATNKAAMFSGSSPASAETSAQAATPRIKP